jgi:D-alanyl-D-alanine carboxypeptidase (penicillin-binding protein 5/6)
LPVDLWAVRRHPLVALLGLLLAIVSAVLSGAQFAYAAAPTPPAPALPPPGVPPPGTPGLAPPLGPQAWVVVDADTGNVVNAADDHTPMRPASISKVLTAIVATQYLPANAAVPVSPVAAGTESVNLGMKVGQVWTFTDTLHAMLMLSANDAATALAERVSGSREAFAAQMDRTAAALRLVDHPIVHDPAGLDDQFSVLGGNVVSAYDLAIIARAALAIPEISQIVDLPEYRFTAPDGVVHVIRNVDRGLGLYPGAVGIKTGYTKAAGNTYMAAATRNGRTMVAVVLQSPDIYRSASALLDLGFATPVARESRVDHLPAVSTSVPAPAAVTTPQPVTPRTTGLAAAPSHDGGFFGGWLRDIAVAVAGAVLVLGIVVVVLRRRAVRRRRSRLGPLAARRY